MLLVSLLFFIVNKYVFLETVCKIIDGKIYLLIYLLRKPEVLWWLENKLKKITFIQSNF